MTDILLTADRTLMTNYNGYSTLGYIGCLPDRLVPNFAKGLLFPKLKNRDTTYGLCKLEAKLLKEGFNVKILPPQDVAKINKIKPKVIGVSTVDPLTRKPGPWTLKCILGGGESVYETEFKNLLYKINKLKKKQNFKIIIGGLGAEDLESSDKYSHLYDSLVIGNAEGVTQIFKKAVSGEQLPKKFISKSVEIDESIIIKSASRNGYVQITYGCPRNCNFCKLGIHNLKSFSKEKILKEIEICLKNNIKLIHLLTEDILLYGSQSVYVNQNAVVDLIGSVVKLGKKYDATTLNLSNASIAATVQGKYTIKKITDIAGFSKEKPLDIVIGVETGSERLIKKHMSGKASPFNPENWRELVKESINIQNDNYWYPWISLIAGLPDENERDVIKTLDLIDDLKQNKIYYFIFYFSPASKSRLEKSEYFSHDEVDERRWELFSKCWMHTIKYMKKDLLPSLHPSYPGNKIEKINQKLLNYIITQFLKEIEKELKKYKDKPQEFKNDYSSVSLKGINLFKYIIR